jgi:hypothetical protein
VNYGLGFYISEEDILHSHCGENHKFYVLQIIANLLRPFATPQPDTSLSASNETGKLHREQELADGTRSSSALTAVAVSSSYRNSSKLGKL